MKVRRIVTGHDNQGLSVVASDEEVEGFDVGGGNVMCPIWGRSDTAHFPDDGGEPPTTFVFPTVGGCSVGVYRMTTGGARGLDEFITESLGPWADPNRAGMHRTPTLDFVLVVSGDIFLELDDGEVLLHAGDVVVQNGTNHRWNNRGSVDAVLVGVNIGAEHAMVSSG